MEKIKDYPTAGYQYKVKEGESLSIIAGKAYGDIYKWPIIYRANLTILKSENDPDLIFPDEIINIPTSGNQFQEKLTGKAADEMTIIVDGLEIPVVSARIIRTMNTLSDAWSAVLPWKPGVSSAFDESTKPYQYPVASAYIGGELLVGGILYGVEVSSSAEGGRAKNLSGFSFTADAIDSNLKPPYEVNNVTLFQRAKDLLSPLGISVELEVGIESEGGRFDRVTASPTDTIFSHLASLAAQKSIIMSSDSQGNVIFLRANTDGKTIGTIKEGEGGDAFQGLGALEYSAEYDGRKKWNSYKVISSSPNSVSATAVAKDNSVPRSRFKNIEVNDVTAGELKTVAEWERNKVIAKAMTIPVPVATWYGPNGDLWRENTLVTVVSETIFSPEGFTYLIQQVEFIYEVGGLSAVLSLVPPTVYSKGEIIEPWG